MNRGALPLVILIVAALAAGIAVAIIQPGDLGEEEAAPEPTATAESPLPTTPASPEPTTPSPTPTEEPTPKPTEEPTPEPEPTEDGNGRGAQNGEAEPTLAETGGPVLPWLLGGGLLFAGGIGLWRLRRRLGDT